MSEEIDSTGDRKQVAIPKGPAEDLVAYISPLRSKERDVTDGQVIVAGLVSLWERTVAEQDAFIVQAHPKTYWLWRQQNGPPENKVKDQTPNGVPTGR